MVAVADKLEGPYRVQEKSLIEPSGPIEKICVNPAITQGPDKKFYLIIKGDKPKVSKRQRSQAMAISASPLKGFKMQNKAVIDGWDTEDMSLWYDESTKHFYAIFHAHHYLGLMASRDGLNWEKATDYEVTTKAIKCTDGTVYKPSRVERPFVYCENGVPRTLCVATMRTGDLNEDTAIITIPLAAPEKK